MRRILIAALATLSTFVLEPSAHAVFLDDPVHYIKHGYRRNELWPWPFVCPDRLAVREPLCIMVHNGWRRQNLLGAHHFNAKGDQLNTAGELRVRWIMTQAPPERRTIFVERAVEPHQTAQRLAVVRDYAAQVCIDGTLPQVTETHLVSEGRPAAIVDVTNTKFHETMPPPKLPTVTVSAGSGSSSQ